MGERDHLLHRVDRSERVRDVDNSDYLHAWIEHLLVFVKLNLSTLVDWNDADLRAGPLGEELPGDYIRMMFHHRQQNLVAGADEFRPKTVGDKVDALGYPVCQDDLVRFRGVDKVLNLDPCTIEFTRRHFAQVVDATVYIRVLLGVEAAHGVDDHLWTLGSRRAVQVDQRAALDHQGKNWKVVSNPLDVKNVMLTLLQLA